MFEAGHWPDAGVAGGPGGGRGEVLMFEHEGRRFALRHFYRGGLARFLSADRYWWTGPDQSRSFREFSLLARMTELGLPVPQPAAARVVRRGFLYTADLITVRLPDVESLSQRLTAEDLRASVWSAIGRLIARFHARNICHADLNAHNIQIGADNELYLLDFDRGRIMDGPGNWSTANLNRLQRSLLKLQHEQVIRFSEANWQSLLDGYYELITDRHVASNT